MTITEFYSFAIKIQIPIVLFIAYMSYQAYNFLAIKAFKYISIGWTINCLYLIFKLIFEDINKRMEVPLESFLDLLSTYFFLIASLPELSQKHFAKIKSVSNFKYAIIFFGVWILKYILFFFKNYPDYLYNFPTSIVDAIVLYFLALFFYRFRKEYPVSILLFGAILFYSFIQFIALFIDQKSILSNTHFLDILGFSFGLVAKTVILLTFSNLIFNIIKSFSKVRDELKTKNLFAEKLNQIIGRTFHEIVPPLLEVENQISLLIDDNTLNNEFQINKRVRREIDRISGGIYRIKTILSAASKMYYFETLEIDPLSEEYFFPILIEEDQGIQNINTMIEIAITNFRTTIALLTNPKVNYKDIDKNHYVTDKIKIKTEYGGNCNVYGNSVELVQIFYNIFKNSFESSNNSNYICNIYIKTKNIFEFSDFIENGEKKRNNIKKVQIDIEDNGPGISQDNIFKIFDEGFSTKADIGGKGRGFGMSIIKKNIEKFGGEILIQSPINDSRVFDLDSRPGTRITIIFPKITKD